MDDDVEILSGFVATTGSPTDRPDFTMPVEVLERLVEALNAESLPMHLDHDPRQRLNAKVIKAELRKTPDGEIGVWAEWEVPAGAVGDRRGLSFSFMGVFEDIAALGAPTGTVEIFGDAVSFTDDEILDAARAMTATFDVRAGRLYQFAAVAPPAVIVKIALKLLHELPAALLDAGIVEGLKRLLRHGQQTEFNFQLELPTGGTATALLKTADAETVEKAIAAMRDMVTSPGKRQEFDSVQGVYISIEPSVEDVSAGGNVIALEADNE